MLLDEREAGRVRLGKELLPGQLVLRRGADRELALVEIDVHQPPARAERACQAAQVRRPVGEVVVRVDDQDQIARRGRHERVVFEREHGRHVAEPGFPQAFAEGLQDARLDVHGVDVAGIADRPGDRKGEVARAGADVADDLPAARREHPQHLVGLLPFRPGRVLHLRDVGIQVLGIAVVSVHRYRT